MAQFYYLRLYSEIKTVSLCLLAGDGKAKVDVEKVGPPVLKF